MTLVFDSYSESRPRQTFLVPAVTIFKFATIAILAVEATFASPAQASSGFMSTPVRSIQAVPSTFGPLTISDEALSYSKSNMKGPLVLSISESQSSAGSRKRVVIVVGGSPDSHLNGPLVLASEHS